MTIKEQLIREIEEAPEESLIKFMRIWQIAKQSFIPRANLSPTKLSDFFRQSPLAEVAASGELDLNSPFEITEQDGSAFVVVSAEDWEQQQETLFVLQNSHLLEQISRSMATHAQQQGYQPSQEELDEILSV